jgi:hypothetical protein
MLSFVSYYQNILSIFFFTQRADTLVMHMLKVTYKSSCSILSTCFLWLFEKKVNLNINNQDEVGNHYKKLPRILL